MRREIDRWAGSWGDREREEMRDRERESLKARREHEGEKERDSRVYNIPQWCLSVETPTSIKFHIPGTDLCLCVNPPYFLCVRVSQPHSVCVCVCVCVCEYI